MQKPTMFVDRLGDRYAEDPIRMAISKVASAFGANIVDQLVTPEGVEADIAIVSKPGKALSFLKETEHTVVGVMIIQRSDRMGAASLAANNPRVRELDILQSAAGLMSLIAEKTQKEASDADLAGR